MTAGLAVAAFAATIANDQLMTRIVDQLLGGGNATFAHRFHALAPTGTIRRVDAPSRPHVGIDVGYRHAVEGSVVQFDPTLVKLVWHPECLCRLASANAEVS